jgi:hypothetical protein
MMPSEKLWLWLGGGCGLVLLAAGLALWALFGPLVFVNALNSVWTCF